MYLSAAILRDDPRKSLGIRTMTFTNPPTQKQQATSPLPRTKEEGALPSQKVHYRYFAIIIFNLLLIIIPMEDNKI